MILLIDNFDSFVANVARYFRRLGHRTLIRRNDELSTDEIAKLAPQAIVISPGPCRPEQAGQSLEIIREFSGQVPMLGVCLGHQAIAAAYGANIIRAREPYHGRQSTVSHEEHFLFAKVPRKFDACRYHSLVVDEATLSEQQRVIARTSDGTIMALADDRRMLFGLQFHPESILTPFGFQILTNFIDRSGLDQRHTQTSGIELYKSESLDRRSPNATSCSPGPLPFPSGISSPSCLQTSTPQSTGAHSSSNRSASSNRTGTAGAASESTSREFANDS
ncbi:MAG: aminodeoxychorismate/anthranilate synthase component II [Planctomycetota bacterium]|nr:aminodeoxychorismate/anthranilate synthase component II [Planctomycetota bacterium]